ncbi:AbrB/MazE/SpoVT family DNA-binding domain-containing protein [Cytobacillus gottheilii]|uniref:AbrB/MazE/SpoVT family DNA-binding domain-containing protein n=1 Tax=Cytobacillus gottheilii TaxID=859144 RepID=A0ABX8FE40_9BACI|nr:AbrB/MazE/SpoVT family DNA-binding domain-containing protein [Cytobacillus gottheilii]QVY62217.1 AbrB/MazE/SpoVT family DNA-binding domain-containing protein [Cytobacillus gottheilii]
MKSTGIVRKVDELGRIVIPKELRKTLNIQIKDPIEIFVEDEKIILRKYESRQACLVTGEILDDNVALADGKIVLSKKALKDLVEEVNERFELKV